MLPVRQGESGQQITKAAVRREIGRWLAEDGPGQVRELLCPGSCRELRAAGCGRKTGWIFKKQGN